MKIIETEQFRKSFVALENNTQKKAKKSFSIFLKNLFYPSLRTEKLEPKHKNIWSFRIDPGHRVIFTFLDANTILLIDIGQHGSYVFFFE